MITNQVMKRPMGKFLVEQRTKDSMFNATSLLKQWNDFVENNDDTQKIGYVKKKDLDDFFNNKNIKEFIEALMDEENLHTQNSAYVKSRARSDRGGGTWMHPILFVKFAMWLNPRFEVQVIKFVYDQILKYRNGQERHKGTRQFYIAAELLFWSAIVTFTRFTKQRGYDKLGTKV